MYSMTIHACPVFTVVKIFIEQKNILDSDKFWQHCNFSMIVRKPKEMSKGSEMKVV